MKWHLRFAQVPSLGDFGKVSGKGPTLYQTKMMSTE